MEKNLNQPQTGDMVLGGLEGVKKRLASDAVEQKIAALSEAFNYGQAGLDLVIQVLKDKSSPIQSVAYLLLKNKSEQQVNKALQEYYYYKERIKNYKLPTKLLISFCTECRTPLNSIIGSLKLILEGFADDPEEEREWLQEAHRSALHLLFLCNEFEDIIKIEAGEKELELGPVKLDKLFKEVEDLTRPRAQERDLSFSLQMPTNSDEIILYANYEWLKQLMLYLVDNAIKFINEGGVTISAEVSNNSVDFAKEILPVMIRIEVADTGNMDRMGPKIGEEVKTPVFKNCYSSSSYELASKLPIYERFVELMGGTMSFYSQGPGLGSTVTFTVPLV
jgi:hypothetical protein